MSRFYYDGEYDGLLNIQLGSIVRYYKEKSNLNGLREKIHSPIKRNNDGFVSMLGKTIGNIEVSETEKMEKILNDIPLDKTIINKLTSLLKEVSEIINNLSNTAYASKRSTSEIFIGEKSLRSAYTILLRNSKKGEVLRYFYPYADAHEKATPFYYRFYKYQKSKRIVERGIVTLDFKNSKHVKEIPKVVKLRHVDFPLPETIDIFADKLLIVDWSTITGILITSGEITNIFIDYFDNIWKIAQ